MLLFEFESSALSSSPFCTKSLKLTFHVYQPVHMIPERGVLISRSIRTFRASVPCLSQNQVEDRMECGVIFAAPLADWFEISLLSCQYLVEDDTMRP